MNTKFAGDAFEFTIDDLDTVAKTIINHTGTNKIYLFYGDMGAGKTTLIKALCQQLGVTENVSSPTFSIVNEYAIAGGKIYHFDFYRIKNQTEAFDMGYEEYFYSGQHCFIEWPQLIPDLLPPHYVNISIEIISEAKREIHISIF